VIVVAIVNEIERIENVAIAGIDADVLVLVLVLVFVFVPVSFVAVLVAVLVSWSALGVCLRLCL